MNLLPSITHYISIRIIEFFSILLVPFFFFNSNTFLTIITNYILLLFIITYYKIIYDPIISKELFLKVRDKLSVVPKRHPGTVDFAFTKLLYCGACGSGITAEEKFKHQLNGNVHRYVYYHCTCGKNRDCKQPAIREEDLIKQMVSLIDKIDIDKLKTVEKIKKEIQRFQKFNYIMIGGNDNNLSKKISEVNIKNYAKYILLEGTKQEKRDLLKCLKSKLILKDKVLRLE